MYKTHISLDSEYRDRAREYYLSTAILLCLTLLFLPGHFPSGLLFVIGGSGDIPSCTNSSVLGGRQPCAVHAADGML